MLCFFTTIKHKIFKNNNKKSPNRTVYPGVGPELLTAQRLPSKPVEAEASKGTDFREKVMWSKILKPSQVQHVRVLQGEGADPGRVR